MKQHTASLEREPVTEAQEAERVTPTDAFQVPVIDPDATLLAMPALLPLAPTPLPPAPPPASVEPALAPSSTPNAAQPSARASFAGSFQSASWPKRLTLLLLPIAIGLFVFKAVRQRAEAQLEHHPAAALPSVSAAAAIDSAAAASTVSAALPSAASEAASSDPHPAGPSLERRAVDAFATGNFGEAARLYQRLAAENPKQMAFAVAARLAHERANGVSHE